MIQNDPRWTLAPRKGGKRKRLGYCAIIGARFGTCTVLSSIPGHLSRSVLQCDCGRIFPIHTRQIWRRPNQKCGECRKQEMKKSALPFRAERKIYSFAKTRCQKPSASNFKYYGGRGIEFRFQSFEEFFAELGPRPSPELTIDRINNNGHYERGNVRWATKSEQQRNKRRKIGIDKTNPPVIRLMN